MAPGGELACPLGQVVQVGAELVEREGDPEQALDLVYGEARVRP